ncbi:histidine kinase [Curvibacter sp. CHRR-16]|nr:histidine kinase [Curvibacter sp. CHRR-16]
MKDSEILSTQRADLTGWSVLDEAPVPVHHFSGCDLGVVLRSVVLVHVTLAVVCAIVYVHWELWVPQWAFLTGTSLPATLLWLLLACAASKPMAHWSEWLQGSAMAALGAVCAMLAVVLLAWMDAQLQPNVPAVAAAGALLALGLWQLQVWRSKARQPADTAARLAGLQARIRPHFLFNTLNSAIALVRAEPAQAERLLEDLSDLFRQALADSDSSVPLAQEIELAERYLSIEHIRFGARLQLRWNLDPAANAAKVPPLLLQPLVENAITHGVEPSLQGAQVEISTRVRGGSVVLKVRNSVPAGPGKPGHGLALRNVQERLTLLHDVQAHFRSRLRDGIYEVRLEFPL